MFGMASCDVIRNELAQWLRPPAGEGRGAIRQGDCTHPRMEPVAHVTGCPRQSLRCGPGRRGTCVA